MQPQPRKREATSSGSHPAGRAARAAARTVRRRPWLVVVGLVAAQEALVLGFALAGPHRNGWVFYQGGDQIWHATGADLLAHLEMPYAVVGYGWSLVLLPFSALLGSSYLQVLPAAVMIGTLVLLPAACALVYAIGRMAGGTLVGLVAATGWVAAPLASIPFFVDRYHDRWVDQFLPQALGLTAMADLPSLVLLLACAALVLRSLRDRSLWTAASAGLVMGFAAGVKPSNFLFLAGPALTYLAARHWRAAAAFAVALTPALLTLAIWKARGIGSIPAFAQPSVTVAAPALGQPVGSQFVDRYLNLHWDVFEKNIADLRSVLWGARVWMLLPLAGAIALARRSLPAAGLLVGWLLAFAITKGANPFATVDSGSVFRLLMPAWPAWVVLVASLALVVPRLGPRPLEPPFRRAGTRLDAGVLAVVAAVVPLVWVASSDPIEGPARAIQSSGLLTPVSGDLGAKAISFDGGIRLSWRYREWNARVFYRVYRFDGPVDVTCQKSGATLCNLQGNLIGTTRGTAFVDATPRAGDVTYRVGVGANWIDDENGGDIVQFSPPLRVPATR